MAESHEFLRLSASTTIIAVQRRAPTGALCCQACPKPIVTDTRPRSDVFLARQWLWFATRHLPLSPFPTCQNMSECVRRHWGPWGALGALGNLGLDLIQPIPPDPRGSVETLPTNCGRLQAAQHNQICCRGNHGSRQ